MKLKKAFFTTSRPETDEIFAATVKGDANQVADCIARGCSVEERNSERLTPLCVAIRNGETEAACLLVRHSRLFSSKEPSIWDLAFLVLFAFLSGTISYPWTDDWLKNLLFDGTIQSLGLFSLQQVVKFLLKGVGIRTMSEIIFEVSWLYSIIRIIVFRLVFPQCMSNLANAYSDKFKEVAPSKTSQNTNLTKHGHDAIKVIPRRGRKAEPIILEILRAGFRLKNVRHLEGTALDIWSLAAREGHIEVSKAMQAMGVDVDTGSGIALRSACYALNAGLVEHFLDSGAIVNPQVNSPPLIQSVASGINACDSKKTPRQEGLLIVAMLVAKGVDINAPDASGRTAIAILSQYNVNEDVVASLLSHGADPAIQDDTGTTPLHGVSRKTRTLTKMLLDAGASPTVRNKNGLTPIDCAAKDEDSLESLKLLIDSAGPVFMDWSFLLFEASMYGPPEMLEYLLSKGAISTIEFKKDTCALFRVLEVFSDRPERTMTLLRYNADVRFATKSGRTILHNLIHNFHWKARDELVRVVIAKGADIEALRYRDPECEKGALLVTPLWDACLVDRNFSIYDGAHPIIKQLLSAGANPYIEIKPGEAGLCTERSGRRVLNSRRNVRAMPIPIQSAKCGLG